MLAPSGSQRRSGRRIQFDQVGGFTAIIALKIDRSLLLNELAVLMTHQTETLCPPLDRKLGKDVAHMCFDGFGRDADDARNLFV
jgi:O-succinylbenzoate synthase